MSDLKEKINKVIFAGISFQLRKRHYISCQLTLSVESPESYQSSFKRTQALPQLLWPFALHLWDLIIWKFPFLFHLHELEPWLPHQQRACSWLCSTWAFGRWHKRLRGCWLWSSTMTTNLQGQGEAYIFLAGRMPDTRGDRDRICCSSGVFWMECS